MANHRRDQKWQTLHAQPVQSIMGKFELVAEGNVIQ
jgi:hypothetical protein